MAVSTSQRGQAATSSAHSQGEGTGGVSPRVSAAQKHAANLADKVGRIVIGQRLRLGEIHLRRITAETAGGAVHAPLPSSPASHFHFPGANLTARELEISQLLLSGYSSKGIAQRLGIATDTVKAHRKHLYSKLGINSQGELFSLFLRDSARQG